MPALTNLPKGHGKAQLDNWYTQKLVHGCADKPRLAAHLKPDMDKWAGDLALVPDQHQDLPIPTNQNTNQAFLNRIKANAKAHDDLLNQMQDMMAANVQYGPKFEAKVRKARGLVEDDVKQWDINQNHYDREIDAYEDKNKAQRSDYHETLKALRMRLESLRVRYNRSYMFEELLDDNSRRLYFLDQASCIGYVPAQHCWKAGMGLYEDKVTKVVTTGTYIYDFRNNAFQLHVHCNPHDGEVRTIRVKLYAEKHGAYSNSKADNKAITARFREKYPPDGSGHWVQVAL